MSMKCSKRAMSVIRRRRPSSTIALKDNEHGILSPQRPPFFLFKSCLGFFTNSLDLNLQSLL